MFSFNEYISPPDYSYFSSNYGQTHSHSYIENNTSFQATRHMSKVHKRTPDLQYELMSIFVQKELAAQWTLVVLALIFSFTSMFWAPEQQAIIWLAIIVAAKISLLEICRKFASTPQKK